MKLLQLKIIFFIYNSMDTTPYVATTFTAFNIKNIHKNLRFTI